MKQRLEYIYFLSRHISACELLLLFILIAFVIRLILVFNVGIFYDEGVILYKALEISDGKILYSEIGDNRTPLVISTLALLLKLPALGGNLTTLYFLRIVFVLFSLLTIPVIYAIGRDIFDKRVGLIAAAFLTFEPLIIGQSIQVIPETVAAYSILIAVFFLVRAIRNRNSSHMQFLLSGLFLSVALLSHLYASISIVAIGIYMIVSNFIDPDVRQNFRDNFLKPGIMLLIGAGAPLIVFIVISYFTKTWDDFLISMNFASSTAEIWHAVGLVKKLDYFQHAVLYTSSIFIWVFGISGAIYSVIKPNPLSILLLLWLAISFALNLFLPQSPGYIPSYIIMILPLAILAAHSILELYRLTKRYNILIFRKTSIAFRIKLWHILVPLTITLIILISFGYYNSINSIRDPGHKTSITTPSLSDQIAISSFLANSTDAEAKFLTFTTSYTFLSDREAVNHFTFGPEFATRDQLEKAIINQEIDYVLLDPRTEYRLNHHYPGGSLESLELLAWVNITNGEDEINDGMNILVHDNNNKTLNYWVHCRNWALPGDTDDMAHDGQLVEEGVWNLIHLNISQMFVRNYGYYPDEATIKFIANANNGSDIEFLIDEIVIYDNESVLYYEDFDRNDICDELFITGTGSCEVVTQGYRDMYSLSLRTENAIFSLEPYEASSSILGTIYTYYDHLKTFFIKRHQFTDELLPVQLLQSRPKDYIPKTIWVEECGTEFCNDDSTRETACWLYGSWQILKLLELTPIDSDKAYLRIFMQENGNAPSIGIEINDHYIGELKARNLPDISYNAYQWREVAFNTDVLNSGVNRVILNIPSEEGSTARDFWRIGADNDNAGNSFYSTDGFKWHQQDAELMICIEICDEQMLVFQSTDVPQV